MKNIIFSNTLNWFSGPTLKKEAKTSLNAHVAWKYLSKMNSTFKTGYKFAAITWISIENSKIYNC